MYRQYFHPKFPNSDACDKIEESVYAVFVDFRKAFDSVNHNILFNKLLRMGVSSKFDNIVANFYSKALACIRVNNRKTNNTQVTRGVLQGESLSPTLFALLLSDLEEFLLSKGCIGISIDCRTRVLLLAYADDIVLFADTPTELRRILDALKEYCDLNELVINTAKTKIVQFRRGRRTKNNQKTFQSFNFGEDVIEVVEEYTYLGTFFSNACDFRSNAKITIEKTNIAIGSTLKTIYKSKAFSWSMVQNLHGSLIRSILMYGAQVWSLEYLEMLEKTNILFFRRILQLPTNTPDYAIRLEAGVSSIKLTVFKYILN